MQDLLRVLYLPVKQCVSLLSTHSLSVSDSHFSLLKWETPTFISAGLWPQHPDMNPVNDQICSEMQQQVYLKKVCNMNGPTLWPAGYGFDLCVISNAIDEWRKCLRVCVHVKGRLSEYLV